MAFITTRELKIYLVIVGLVAVLAVFITLLILLPGYFQHNKIEKTDGVMEADYSDVLSEFRVPGPYSKLLNEDWKRFYIPEGEWPEEKVKEYWINPENMILEYLDEKNTELIEDILGKYE